LQKYRKPEMHGAATPVLCVELVDRKSGYRFCQHSLQVVSVQLLALSGEQLP
jgi:hypothetical protein